VYSGSGAGLDGRIGDAQMTVEPGTGANTLSVTITVPDGATSIALGSVLRLDASTLVSPSNLPEVTYPVDVPEPVASSTQIVSASPSPGTVLTAGDTYTFTANVDYSLGTAAPAFLELSAYAEGADTGRIGDSQVSVDPGSGARTLSVTITVPDDATSISLASVLRTGPSTLISPFMYQEIVYSVG